MFKLSKDFVSKYLQSEFIRNSLTLISGTAIAQFIGLLLTPILTRYYTTEDFGELSVFMSISGILAVVATMRYEMAIVLPEKDEDAQSLVALSFLITLIWSALSLVAIILFSDLIIDYFEGATEKGFLYLVPLVVLLLGLIQVLNYWSIRIKTYKNNAYARIGNTLTNNGVSLCFGLFRVGSIGLILGFALAQLASTAILAKQSYHSLKGAFHNFDWTHIKKNAKRYKNFPKINATHALVGSFQENGIVFFMKSLFGLSVLGSYSFAYRLLSLPSSFISGAISQVLTEKASKLVNQGESIKKLVLNIYKVVFLVGIPVFATLFFFGPQLFAFVFSENYREAGELAQILAPWMFLNFVANSASGIPIIYNRLSIPFLFTCIDITLKIFSIYIGWYFQSFKIGFTVMSISCSLLLLVTFVWIYSLISNPRLKRYE